MSYDSKLPIISEVEKPVSSEHSDSSDHPVSSQQPDLSEQPVWRSILARQREHSDSSDHPVSSEQPVLSEQPVWRSGLSRQIEQAHQSEQVHQSKQAPVDPAIISSKLKAPPQEQPAQTVADDKIFVQPTKPSSAPTSTTADSKVESKPDVKTAHQRKHVFGRYGRAKAEWHEAMKQVLDVHGER